MPLSYVATSKEYGNGKGGTTWKALREERPVTPNFDPIRQAIKIRVMLPYLCVAIYEGTRVEKTEVNTRQTDRYTCDLKHDPIRACLRAPWRFKGTKVDKKGFNILPGWRSHL